MILPARMAVLNYMSKVDKACTEDVMEALKADYGKDGQFRPAIYLEHLMALDANGFLSLTEYKLREDGQMNLYYSITEDGRQSVEKYIPSKYR